MIDHARIPESSIADLAVVVDVDAEAAKRVAQLYGGVPSTELGGAIDCDGVIVAGALPHAWTVCSTAWEAFRCSWAFANACRTGSTARRRTAEPGAVMCGFVERFNAAFALLCKS